jgi:hypothetical protein
VPYNSGRIVFELGAAFSGQICEYDDIIFHRDVTEEVMRAAEECVELHDKWCGQAKEAIRCWLVIARRKRVVKDIRKVVARMLWEQRASWSEVEVGWPRWRLVVL